MPDAIAVFTRESRRWINDHGCTGNWHLGPDGQRDWQTDYRGRGITHAICCRNADKRRDLKPGDIDDIALVSHAAFLVGQIKGVRRVDDDRNGKPRHAIDLINIRDVDRPYFWYPYHVRPEFRSLTELDDFGLPRPGAAADMGSGPSAKQSRFRLPDGDCGPSGGGQRSEAIWEARHSPLINEIAAVLDRLQCRVVDGGGWRPDLIRITPSGKTIVIEVKPDAGLHNMITAVGQSICYRFQVAHPISIIAAPGISEADEALAKVMKEYDIQALELNSDFSTKLAQLVDL